MKNGRIALSVHLNGLNMMMDVLVTVDVQKLRFVDFHLAGSLDVHGELRRFFERQRRVTELQHRVITGSLVR